MKKATRLMSLMVILGLLAALPASAQVDAIGDEAGSNLGLLITINRLELTADQMQQIRDILVGVLDEANALKESRDAFEQEMLRFNGTGEELDAFLEGFQEEQAGQAAVLQETAQDAIDELKSILTFKQGETLINMLNPLVEGRLGTIALGARVHAIGSSRMQIQGGVADESTISELRERIMDRVREWIGDEGTGTGQRRGYMANCPGLEMRLRGQGWREFAKDAPLGRLDALEQMGEQLGHHPFLATQFGGRALGWLEELVELLEMKLQYIE
jgi:hypothetical protein